MFEVEGEETSRAGRRPAARNGGLAELSREQVGRGARRVFRNTEVTDVAEENSAGVQPSWAAGRENSEAEKSTDITGGVKERCDGGSKSRVTGDDLSAWQKRVGSRKHVNYQEQQLIRLKF